jgi:YrbI family 3-deoxy-D-manno-octulosonate 8-phosphate phosphatase
MSHYATNIRFLLQQRGLSEQFLSEQFGVVDAGHPSPQALAEISEYFSVSLDVLLKRNLQQLEVLRSKDIRLVVFDIDGVMTDGGMFYTESGDEFKKFNAKDGLAIRRLAQRGIHTGIITHGFNTELIRRRAERLHISKFEVSQTPKKQTLEKWCAEWGITLEQVCYIGDDLNDEDIIRAVGFSACPADAVPEVQQIVHVILQKNGGDGCIRELIDNYL